MLANQQKCRQNADQSRCPYGPTRMHTHRAEPLHRSRSLDRSSPTPPTHPKVGIGPEALPERKKPNLGGWAKRLYY